MDILTMSNYIQLGRFSQLLGVGIEGVNCPKPRHSSHYWKNIGCTSILTLKRQKRAVFGSCLKIYYSVYSTHNFKKGFCSVAEKTPYSTLIKKKNKIGFFLRAWAIAPK